MHVPQGCAFYWNLAHSGTFLKLHQIAHYSDNYVLINEFDAQLISIMLTINSNSVEMSLINLELE
jgi:hypothetical protein